MNKPTRSLRLGMICPRWLPSYGGGQQYAYRLAQTLIARGLDVRVFAGTAAQAGLENGDVAATRHTPHGNIFHMEWVSAAPGQNSAELTEVMKQYDFMAAAVAWAKANELDIALVGQPFQLAALHQARELYTSLQALGMRVGCLHFDLGRPVRDALRLVYLQGEGEGDWEAAAGAVSRNLNLILRNHAPVHAYYMMASPLFLSPDFVISCSDWSGRFIDPDNRVPKLTVHPLMDAAYWGDMSGVEPLDARDVLMVNPQSRKGPEHMAGLIATSPPGRTFRILQGGWGNPYKKFIPAIEQLPASLEGRVELRDYLKDVRQAYAATGTVFFPSLYEGYGMTAVEPMFSGVPVVSSNYPAVVEAVGDAAATLCPFRAQPAQWSDVVEDVLSNPAPWRDKGLERAAVLEHRQVQEVDALVAFLGSLRQRPRLQPGKWRTETVVDSGMVSDTS